MKYLLVFALLATPFLAFAHDGEDHSTSFAGTDQYLRHELLWTDEQLSTEVSTNDRALFDAFSGEGTVEDPLGDVLDRNGTTADIALPWGDVTSVTVAKNVTTSVWDVTIVLGGEIPGDPTQKVQLYFLADTDGSPENNVDDGIRAEMDAEFAIQHNSEAGWYTDFRWFNPEANFWAIDKETTSTFEVRGNTIAIHIPFAEIGGDAAPRWRVVMAVQDADAEQIDAAPTIGFPSALPTSNTDGVSGEEDVWGILMTWQFWLIIAATALVIALAAASYVLRLARRR